MSPSKAASNSATSQPTIQVIYPSPNHTLFEDSTFIMGQIKNKPKNAVFLIDGNLVPVSQQGFFAWKISVPSGNQRVLLNLKSTVQSKQVLAQHTLPLEGISPYSLLSSASIGAIAETLQPQTDVWLTPTDILTVACFAGEKASVALSFPGWLEKTIPLVAYSQQYPFVDTRETIFAQPHWTKRRIPTRGYYELQIRIADLLEISKKKSLPVEQPMQLIIQRGGKQYTVPIPGKLKVLTQSISGTTIGTAPIVSRTHPPEGARLTPQCPQTTFQFDALQKGWLRAKLNADEHFFLPQEQVTLHSNASTPLQLVSIEAQSPSSTLANCEANIALLFQGNPTNACPILIETPPSKEQNRLIIRLYNVCSTCDFIQYAPHNSLIQQIHWRSVANNTLEVWIDLTEPIAGYDYQWRNGSWHLWLQALPKQIKDIKILIDPGHGGTEHGATGLNGLPEKTLNLNVAKQLQQRLKQAGFQVKLTRTQDQTLSLPARGEKVKTEKPHMVISLHHNALPDGRDPLKAEGACCFYYHSFSKPLANKLLQGLTSDKPGLTDIPNYGLFYDSLYMTRIHQALAVLVEVGFFTNPHEFERLIQPAFQQEVVNRLAQALVEYCKA